MENLRNMPFEAIVGMVEDYPWFGAAQRVLCEKMSLMGGRDLARDIYASAALQVASRRKIINMLRPDAFPEGGRILRDYAFVGEVNKNYRGAGDYFSREQYERVKKEAQETATAGKNATEADGFNFDRDVSLDGFCTEALAEIYAEQGYFERAKDIYSKLILAYPEKNTYFASLIEKLNEKI